MGLMAAECVPRFRVVLRYIVQRYLTRFVFNTAGNKVRIKERRDNMRGNTNSVFAPASRRESTI